jgi:uncharacterized protein DUF4174
MIRIAWLGLMLLTPAMAQATADDLRSVSGMETHNRALLVFAPSLADPRMTRQHAIMAQLAVQAAARDLLFVQVDKTRVIGSHDTANSLRRRFRVPADSFRAVLIDKNGQTVLAAPAPLAGGAIIRAIDARR